MILTVNVMTSSVNSCAAISIKINNLDDRKFSNAGQDINLILNTIILFSFFTYFVVEEEFLCRQTRLL